MKNAARPAGCRRQGRCNGNTDRQSKKIIIRKETHYEL